MRLVPLVSLRGARVSPSRLRASHPRHNFSSFHVTVTQFQFQKMIGMPTATGQSHRLHLTLILIVRCTAPSLALSHVLSSGLGHAWRPAGCPKITCMNAGKFFFCAPSGHRQDSGRRGAGSPQHKSTDLVYRWFRRQIQSGESRITYRRDEIVYVYLEDIGACRFLVANDPRFSVTSSLPCGVQMGLLQLIFTTA